MGRVQIATGLRLALALVLVLVSVSVSVARSASGGEVAGRVTMPEVCLPAVSPAVVWLEPDKGAEAAAPGPAAPGSGAEVALINQQGLQFTPRVQAIALGQSVRFTNTDAETHNVHIGNDFNMSMSPGQPATFTPGRAGVYTLLCDVHSHMRGYLIVSRAPWVDVCSRQGRFRLTDVPDGRYVLRVWHEMGTPGRQEVVVAAGAAVDLGTLALTVPQGLGSGRGPGTSGPAAAVRPWPRVIEKIGLLLASSLDAAGRPGGLKAARTLAEDAYWGEFEASDMETAVRIHLGFARAGALEEQFRAMVAGVADVARGQQPAAQGAALSSKLLSSLISAARDLDNKGVTDASRIFATAHPGTGTQAVSASLSIAGDDEAERHRQLAALKRGLAGVADLAGRGEADEAASAMTAVYFDQFEPIERFVAARKPQDVRPLEMQFSALRGQVAAGLKGEALAAKLAGLQTDVETALGRSEAQRAGTFGAAFVNSLIVILREGAEVILLLAMLVALAARSGEREPQRRAGALRAIGWGVALAIVASLGTAWGLNRLVASAQGRTRELLEGVVMLVAAGVLFYVSYWLIAQSASRRWLEFLKRQAQRGAALGGFGTLALTAFLGVYREGAETALMYQALLGTQGQSRAGLLGLAAGLAVGLVLLAALALIVRATSVRLPLRAFFKFSGAVLFGLAVVFAGNAIFELQQCGLLKTTTLAGPLTWLGQGIPLLGLYPNVQTLSIQALLLAGAAMALVLVLVDQPADEARVKVKVGG
jgi:high-affinity iron transporter